MGWPKGKLRKSKESSGGDEMPHAGPLTRPEAAIRSQHEAVTPLTAGPKKRDPARKANTEIRKVLKQLELARAKVKELEATVAEMTSALTGAVAPKQQWPTGISNLLQPEPEEPPGQAAPLAPGDSMGDGRWV